MNIKEIFNSIANSIRSKLGTEDKILPIDYSNEIDKIVVNIIIDKDINEYIECICKGLYKYNGSVEGLSIARYDLAGTSVGDYALFAGGYNNNFDDKFRSTVDSYNSSLVHGIPADLNDGRTQLSVTSIGNYALFGGGSNTEQNILIVDTYNSSLSKGTATDLSVARTNISATSVGSYAIFAGGFNPNFDNRAVPTVDTYNSSLTYSTATALTESKRDSAATTIGDYALFGGGVNDISTYATVDTYNSSLTKGTASDLGIRRQSLAATSVGNYALFGGGVLSTNSNNRTYFSNVDSYDSSLVHNNQKSLSQARSGLKSTSVGDYALFAGGLYLVGTKIQYTSTVDSYSTTLVGEINTKLKDTKVNFDTASIGSYALFAGGYSGDYIDNVDVYVSDVV